MREGVKRDAGFVAIAPFTPCGERRRAAGDDDDDEDEDDGSRKIN